MEISLGEAITMTARNKPDAPSFVFADGSAHTFAQTNARGQPARIRAAGRRRQARRPAGRVLAGLAPSARRLAAHCGQRLATYKVPAEFRFTDALPVNASGKILKRELRTRD